MSKTRTVAAAKQIQNSRRTDVFFRHVDLNLLRSLHRVIGKLARQELQSALEHAHGLTRAGEPGRCNATALAGTYDDDVIARLQLADG